MNIKLLVFILALLILSITSIAATREDAVLAVENVEAEMIEMAQEGISVNAINDSIIDVKLALERADFAVLVNSNAIGELADAARKALLGMDSSEFSYEGVIQKTELIRLDMHRIYASYDSVKLLEKELVSPSSEGISMKNGITGFLIYPIKDKIPVDKSNIESRIPEVKSALAEGRYEDAEKLIAELHAELDAQHGGAALKEVITSASKSFIEKNLPSLMLIFSIIIAAAVIGSRRYRFSKAKKKLRKLKIEEKTLVTSIKRTQIKRFKKGTIPNSVYRIRMDIYHQKLNDVKKEIPVLREMLKKGRV